MRLELCNRGEFGLLSSRDKNRANTIKVFFNKNRFRQTLGLCAVLDVPIELQGFMLDIYLEKCFFFLVVSYRGNSDGKHLNFN